MGRAVLRLQPFFPFLCLVRTVFQLSTDSDGSMLLASPYSNMGKCVSRNITMKGSLQINAKQCAHAHSCVHVFTSKNVLGGYFEKYFIALFQLIPRKEGGAI